MRLLLAIMLSFLPLIGFSQKFTIKQFFAEIDSTCIYPDIVKAQSILETGYFTSRLCREDRNYFGMTSYYSNRYAKYKHWKHSVRAYSAWQKRRFAENPNMTRKSYLKMLDNKYCWEVNYSERIMKLMNSKYYKNITKK